MTEEEFVKELTGSIGLLHAANAAKVALDLAKEAGAVFDEAIPAEPSRTSIILASPGRSHRIGLYRADSGSNYWTDATDNYSDRTWPMIWESFNNIAVFDGPTIAKGKVF